MMCGNDVQASVTTLLPGTRAVGRTMPGNCAESCQVDQAALDRLRGIGWAGWAAADPWAAMGLPKGSYPSCSSSSSRPSL